MSEEQDIPTDDTVAGEDTEGHKRHFRVEESGGEDTEGHKKHFRIEESGEEDTEGHKKHVRIEESGEEDTWRAIPSTTRPRRSSCRIARPTRASAHCRRWALALCVCTEEGEREGGLLREDRIWTIADTARTG